MKLFLCLICTLAAAFAQSTNVVPLNATTRLNWLPVEGADGYLVTLHNTAGTFRKSVNGTNVFLMSITTNLPSGQYSAELVATNAFVTSPSAMLSTNAARLLLSAPQQFRFVGEINGTITLQ